VILVIDDDPLQIRYYVEELRSRGLRVVVAGSVAEARRWLRSETPSLVVLDVRLPLFAPGDLPPTECEHTMVSGLTLLREIRQQDPELPVILFTALSDGGAAMGLDSNTRLLRKEDVLPHELADLVQAALLG
jgi:CheY-like chemotaxis protein